MLQKKQSQPLTPRTQSANSIPSQADKVKVILRVRPILLSEQPQQFLSLHDVFETTIEIRKMGMPSMMKFNYVQIESNSPSHSKQFEKEQSQIKIYKEVQETIDNMFSGIDGTIFAYGQTGAGKTYTIVGDCPQSAETGYDYIPYLMNTNKGIMIRAMEEIVSTSRKRKDCRITISFYEIYNEKIFDLLTNNPKPLEIRENKNGELAIYGLIKIQIVDLKQCLGVISEGLKNRVTSSTSGNIKSSRSHSIFQVKCERLKIDKKTNEHQIVISNMRIVDLAGSEKFNIPPDLPATEREIRLTELKSINGSLSKLGHCISALTNQNRSHIPFRDSKLTRILRESFIGSGRIRLIVCVSSSNSAMNETLSTLQFADRVKKAIFDRPSSHTPQKKKMIELTEYESVVAELQKERAMRIQLQKILHTVKQNPSQLELIRQNHRLRQQLVVLKQELKVFHNRNKIAGGLSISRSRAKGVNQTPKSPLQKNYLPSKSINGMTAKSIKNISHTNTPPKAVSSKSVIETDQKAFMDSVYERSKKAQKNYPKNDSHKQGSKPDRKSPTNGPSTPTRSVNNKMSFENRIKKFMDKNDESDRELQEKVKQRLLEIRRQIIHKKEWSINAPFQQQNKTFTNKNPSIDITSSLQDLWQQERVPKN